MTASSCIDRLLDLAARRFGRPEGTLRPQDDLFETLGIDSLGALDLLTELEEAFDVEIPDYELSDVRRFEELAALIDARR